MRQNLDNKCSLLLEGADKIMDAYVNVPELLERASSFIKSAYNFGANVDKQLNRLINLYRTS
jgi:hypothetical protein